MAQVVLFLFPSVYPSLVATLTAVGGGAVIETAASVVPSPASTINLIGGPSNTGQWYTAEFSSTLFGVYQLNVYTADYATLLLTTEAVLTRELSYLPTSPYGTDPFGGPDPMARLYVDHLFHGESRVWWRFSDNFVDPGPYVYVLQASFAGHANAIDWVNMITPTYNASYLAIVNKREPTGKNLFTHFRVLIYTPNGRYASRGYPIWGNLDEYTYKLGQEIIRKEKLRGNGVTAPGYLLRRMRYGVKHTPVLDMLTDEIYDTTKLASKGTAFEIGYHPPIACEVEVHYGPIKETRGSGDIQTNNANPRQMRIRLCAQPDIAYEDIWVHGQTDERWLVSDDMTIVASLRGVPLVREASLSKLPHGHIAYKIPVSNLSFDTPTLFGPADYPQIGTGCVPVNHNYDTEDELAYRDSACCGIAGATVKIFTAANYNAGATDDIFVVARTATTTGGQWTQTINLNAGSYVVVFEKPGMYGPDAVPITVVAPIAPVLSPPTTQFVSTFDF